MHAYFRHQTRTKARLLRSYLRNSSLDNSTVFLLFFVRLEIWFLLKNIWILFLKVFLKNMILIALVESNKSNPTKLPKIINFDILIFMGLDEVAKVVFFNSTICQFQIRNGEGDWNREETQWALPSRGCKQEE